MITQANMDDVERAFEKFIKEGSNASKSLNDFNESSQGKMDKMNVKNKPETFSNVTVPINKIRDGSFRNKKVFAKTQKAKGIVHLMNDEVRNNLSKSGLTVPYHYIFSAKGYKSADGEWEFPLFVRPCPVTPRHGFVDSRMVKNQKELEKVFEEVLAVEEEAEVAITVPLPNSDFNFIIAGTNVSFGPGHDGATSGKGNFSFPLVSPPLSFPQDVLGDDGNMPFIEGIISKTSDRKYITQVRAVPQNADISSPDFVPEDIEVLNVVDAGGDLLEWEEKVKNLPAGTVVNHYGGNLSSHFAVHSILQNVPIVTTFVPKVGQTIGKTADSVEFSEEEGKKFACMFAKILDSHPPIPAGDVSTYASDVCHAAVSLLHNSSGFLKRKPIREMAYILASFSRVCLALSVGESRYSKQTPLKKYPKTWSRNSIYRAEFNKAQNLNDIIDSGLNSKKIFSNKSLWGGGSFGGKKWANCTNATLRLMESCLRGDVPKALSELNNVIHEEHNGGFYINKVFQTYLFNQYSANAPQTTIRNLESICRALSRSTGFLWEDLNYEEMSAKAKEAIEKIEGENKKGVKMFSDSSALGESPDHQSEDDDDYEEECNCEICVPTAKPTPTVIKAAQFRLTSAESIRIQVKFDSGNFNEVTLYSVGSGGPIANSVFKDISKGHITSQKNTSWYSTVSYYTLSLEGQSLYYKKMWGGKEITKKLISLNALKKSKGLWYKIA